jgi:hypothetical protein
MTLNDDELLERAKWGKISDDELARVAERLAGGQGDPYTLLHILGKAGATNYRGLVESFLQHREDPMVARLALQILGGFWGETDRYAPAMIEFAQGIDWDVENFVCLMALSLLGEHALRCKDARIIAILLRVFDNEALDPVVREEAYFALGRSIGKEWRDLPPKSRLLDWDSDIDESILAEARRRAASTDESAG